MIARNMELQNLCRNNIMGFLHDPQQILCANFVKYSYIYTLLLRAYDGC